VVFFFGVEAPFFLEAAFAFVRGFTAPGFVVFFEALRGAGGFFVAFFFAAFRVGLRFAPAAGAVRSRFLRTTSSRPSSSRTRTFTASSWEVESVRPT
jgi:hypothetical protein